MFLILFTFLNDSNYIFLTSYSEPEYNSGIEIYKNEFSNE